MHHSCRLKEGTTDPARLCDQQADHREHRLSLLCLSIRTYSQYSKEGFNDGAAHLEVGSQQHWTVFPTPLLPDGLGTFIERNQCASTVIPSDEAYRSRAARACAHPVCVLRFCAQLQGCLMVNLRAPFRSQGVPSVRVAGSHCRSRSSMPCVLL